MEKKPAKNNLTGLDSTRLFGGEKDIDDDIQMSEFALQKNIPLGFVDLGLFATVELQIIHVYDKSRVVVLSADSGTIRDSNKIMLMRLTQLINYLDLRLEYISVIIIEWSITSSNPVAHIVSPDTQRSLISARRCKDLDGYSQQVD
ncbi:unnamed protein product [Rotaria magnacalcarata]|uniref:Uncharacterized protein n=1 Tax=Rotaria magnacalcarata TaxID=392030 RepID=A0A816GJD5_9BILA|nr:unnamed protein product [Rotaria magnacalcarata]